MPSPYHPTVPGASPQPVPPKPGRPTPGGHAVPFPAADPPGAAHDDANGPAGGGGASVAEGATGEASAPTPPTPDDSADRALVERVKRGEPGAWNDLLRRYQDRIYAVCLRLAGNRDLAADLAQDTMVKLVQHIDRYDGRCQFFTWVYRITVNTSLTRLRAEKLRRMPSLDAPARGGSGQSPDTPALTPRSVGTAAHPGEPSSPSRVEQQEARRAVLRAIELLAPEHAAVLVLRDGQGLEYQQIADALEITVGTVKSRLFRARAALRDILEGNVPQPPAAPSP